MSKQNQNQNEDFEQSTIPTHYQIGFDPEKLEGDMKMIWMHPVARLLWCVIKYRHLTSQHFDHDVIRAAGYIGPTVETKGSVTVKQLERILLGSSDPALKNPWNGSSHRDKLLVELAHLINTRQTLTFTVQKRDQE